MSEGSRFRLFERMDGLADALLTEDAPGGDLTTELLRPEGRRGHIGFWREPP